MNKLEPETPEEKIRFRQGALSPRFLRWRTLTGGSGEENKKRRLEAAAKSLLVSPPTPEERLVVHDLFMHSKKGLDCALCNTICLSTFWG